MAGRCLARGDGTPSPSEHLFRPFPPRRRSQVTFYYDPDIGNFYYGQARGDEWGIEGLGGEEEKTDGSKKGALLTNVEHWIITKPWGRSFIPPSTHR